MQVTLVTQRSADPSGPIGAARALQRNLTRRGLAIRTHTRIVRREGTSLIAGDGSHIDADIVVLATGLQANPLVHQTGLPTHAKDGLRVNAQLHSIADPRVFAGGDCAAMEGFNLPKLGVFGVRQAAYIHANCWPV
jgi:NADH dehydrogenase FAD-containing subunit